MRKEVLEFCKLGSLPGEASPALELLKQFDLRFRSIVSPVSDEEARALVLCFGEDGCFGIATSLITLIETAPSWPIADCLQDTENDNISMLRQRAINGGYKL